jgi:hypothetical protein
MQMAQMRTHIKMMMWGSAMVASVIAWDIETVPDLKGFAAAAVTTG